jgi:hypothetical protein
MSELPIEANICEINGPYYPVRLYAVPRVGELIDLFSFIDQADKHPQPRKFYQVVQVVHEVRDVSEKIPQSKGGCHFVTVFVKLSRSKFFKSSVMPQPPDSRN